MASKASSFNTMARIDAPSALQQGLRKTRETSHRVMLASSWMSMVSILLILLRVTSLGSIGLCVLCCVLHLVLALAIPPSHYSCPFHFYFSDMSSWNDNSSSMTSPTLSNFPL